MAITSDTHKNDSLSLHETVINGGFCVGCGACAGINNSPAKMHLNQYGQFQAYIDETLINQDSATHSLVKSVCPFSDEGLNEDQIAQELFGRHCEYHNKIGYHLATYAGFVSERDFRKRGSSGGLGTWIVSNLLSEGLVDGILHVHQNHPSNDDPRLFKYQLSTTTNQVQKGSKSRYYPIELSEVLQIVRTRPGRYAIVGIPCFIKAIRLLMKQDAILASRIKFCVGLVCGHLKSLRFAEMFAWQCGIEPGQLVTFDFRKKLLDSPANKYGIEVTGMKNGHLVTCSSPVRKLYGHNWGWGFFKYKACDYCDDVVAETADVVVGDAWLPQYLQDSQGTNVLIVRHPTIHNLIKQAIDLGKVSLSHLSADEIANSQTSGFNHRREGLAYRLYLADQQREWRPRKRVQPDSNHLSQNQKKRQIKRLAIAEKSHFAFNDAISTGKFSVFVQQMNPLIQKYQELYGRRQPLWKRIARGVKRYLHLAKSGKNSHH